MSRLLLLGLILVTFFSCVFFMSLPFIAKVQRVEQLSRSVDVLIVLGGGDGNRIRHAYSLYDQGISNQFLLTGDSDPFFLTDHLQLMNDYISSLDDRNPSIILEGQSKSTLDHTRFIEPLVKKFNWKKVMIVTSAFHSRRAYYAFKKRWSHLDVQVFISPSDDGIEVSTWWKNYEMAQKVLTEWFRYFLYLLIV